MFQKSPSNGPDSRVGRYDHFIIHVTATPPTLNVDDEWVYRVHRRRGFRTTGYHAIITRDGSWLDHDGEFKCRPIGESGAHVGGCGRGWNSRSFGVSMAGGVDDENAPENNMNAKQFATLKRGLLRFLEIHPSPEFIKIMGHRDLIRLTGAPPKACPCFDVQKWMDSTFQNQNPAVTPMTKTLSEEVEDSKTNDVLETFGKTYKIKARDTFWRVSQLTGVPTSELQARNPGVKDTELRVGQTINL